MSDVIGNLRENLKREEEEEEGEEEIGYEEVKELIDNCKSSENLLSDLAKEIKKSKEEKGWKSTSITYPAEWEPLLESLRDLGERETGFRNLSLMVNIAIVEFLLRHKSNPQPKLTDSIGLSLPSTIESNFNRKFKNYLRNLPEERAREVMLKNAKYLALRASKGKRETEGEAEQAERRERKEVEEWAKKRKEKLKEEAMEKLDKAEEELRAGNEDKAKELIHSVSSLKIEKVRKRINEIEHLQGEISG